MQHTFYDAQSRPVRIGAQLGEGGEGIVYDVQGQSNHVAKIYHPHKKPPVEKLRQLVSGKTERLAEIAAWPLTTLHTRKGGAIAGILMPRILGVREIHDLYQPKYQAQHFPHADWRFMAEVAINCAEAFEEVHRAGFVIGDVNQSNILVRQDASVALVDCDSFQVRVSEKKIYLCTVCTNEFTSFDLAGKDLDVTERTENHDRFGLAVLVFYLLMSGKHPFAAEDATKTVIDIKAGINKRQFVYTRNPARGWPKLPPGAQTLDVFPLPVAALFELAFAPNSDTAGRPTAAAWRAALVEFRDQLQQCPKKHYYHPVSPHCPWCKRPKQVAPPAPPKPKASKKRPKPTAPTWHVPKFLAAVAFVFLMYFLVFGLMFRAKYSQFFPEPDSPSQSQAVTLLEVPGPGRTKTLETFTLERLERLLLENQIHRNVYETRYDHLQPSAIRAIRELDPHWFGGPRHERVVQELFAQLTTAVYWGPGKPGDAASFNRVIQVLELLEVKGRYALPTHIEAAFLPQDYFRDYVRQKIRQLDPNWKPTRAAEEWARVRNS